MGGKFPLGDRLKRWIRRTMHDEVIFPSVSIVVKLLSVRHLQR